MNTRLNHYWRVYRTYLGLAIKELLEYRWNFVVMSSYGAVYIVGMYFLIQTMFTQTEMIGGFSKEEVLFFFSFSTVQWALSSFFFLDGLKRFMMFDVKTGQFDFILLKPISSQFLVAISNPVLEAVIMGAGSLLFFASTVVGIADQITFTGIIWFALITVLGLIIQYNWLAIYASAAFFFEQSSQLLRTYQSLQDHGQYPLTVYPRSVSWLVLTIIPIAFMAYVPGIFLLNRGSTEWIVITLVLTLISSVLNAICWHWGSKHYTSASS